MKKRNIIWDILYPSVFMLLAVFAVTIVVSVAAALITGVSDMSSSTMRPVPLAASAVFYVFVLISQKKQFMLDEMRFGTDRKSVKPGVLAAAVLAAMALADLLENLIAKLGLYELFPQYESVAVQTFQDQNIILLLLTTAVLAPLAEELMFRGMTYRRAKHWFGRKRAVILSAFLFGLYHMNGVQFVYAMLLGLFLAWIYEHSETLIVPMVCHGAANAWEIVLEYGIDQPQRLAGNQRAILLAAEAGLAAIMAGYLFRCFYRAASQK